MEELKDARPLTDISNALQSPEDQSSQPLEYEEEQLEVEIQRRVATRKFSEAASLEK